jgi:hypothetical protein
MNEYRKNTLHHVGARVVEWGRVGLDGRPRGGDGQAVHYRSTRPGNPQRTTIKAHPASTQPPSPLRNPRLRLRLMPVLAPLRSPWGGALLLALVVLLFPIQASAHAATNTGRIYGQLLDGTKRNAPVAGQSVTLQMAQGENASDLTSTTTNAHGIFSFSNLNTDKTIKYALYTLYQGSQYYTDLIDLSSRPVQKINLNVYDATTSIANIAIVQANILIDKADAQSRLITISENYIFENLDLTTYVGSLQAHGSKPNALLFSLPKNARNVSLKSGFDGYQIIQVDSGFATNASISPGLSQFAFSFQVPYTTSNYDFGYTVVYPTVNLSLLVPLNIHTSSAALDSQGPVNANQQTFQQFNAKKLLANTQFHVQLDGLPVSQQVANPQSLNANTRWIILAILLMLAIVGVTWLVYQLSRRQATKRQKQISQTSQRSRDTVTAKSGSGDRQSSNDALPSQNDQQEALLQEMLRLDKAYEAGTIKKAEYAEQRARIKTELRSLMSKGLVEQSATVKKAAKSGKGAT